MPQQIQCYFCLAFTNIPQISFSVFFLKSEFFSDSFEPEIVFNLQEKSKYGIPDATITQESFKIVVETKMYDWFYSEQLMRHLNSFSDEKYKVMITLAPELMAAEKKAVIEKQLKEYNAKQTYPVMHINTTFEGIVLLMRACDIKADENPLNNFIDAGDTYYTRYFATAKRLGITAGVGNNMFAPDKEITRQEMFTLLYNALRAIRQLPETNNPDEFGGSKSLSDFTDEGQIASWAREAMALLVEAGIINGDAGKLAPSRITTRAEMAQVLYKLMTK